MSLEVSSFVEALQKGKVLADPALWADRATLTANIAILLTGGWVILDALGVHFVSRENLGSLSEAITVILLILVKVIDRIHTAANPNAGK